MNKNKIQFDSRSINFPRERETEGGKIFRKRQTLF